MTLCTNSTSKEDRGQWEGNGTGYYCSILGNGYSDRPSFEVEKRPVSEDNSGEAWMQGDFAVPTVFNGNFDTIYKQNKTQPPPGWSFHNSFSTTLQSHLVDAKTLPNLTNYWNSLSSNSAPNYAVELKPSESITHNNFVVPDWGALRFDLFTGALASSTMGTLKVFLDSLDGSTATETDDIYLQKANGNPSQYLNDTHKIGYGETGFETFMIDIPDAWRGKVGTL